MADPIEHVIVLMMENCSFDRMLGMLPGVEGVDLASPQTNPDFPSPTAIAQAKTTELNMALDPEHDLDDCLRQISGPRQGFVADFSQHYPRPFLFPLGNRREPAGDIPGSKEGCSGASAKSIERGQSRNREEMNLEVVCYAGRKADERPVRFRLDGHEYLVEEI